MKYSADIALSMSAIGPVRHPFDEPRLKTRQAKRHLSRLVVLQEDHFATDWYAFEFRPATEQTMAALSVIVQLPGPEYGAVVGDIVHNCRAALDILACLMVRLNGQSEQNVYFPFSRDADSLEDAVLNKHFSRAGTQAVDLLRSLRPYPEGNTLLRALHDLDIYDKHRALIPAGGNITTPEVKAEIIDGRAVISAVQPSNPKMRLVFPENVPLSGYEIIPTLEKIIDLVEETISAFEGLQPAS